MTLKVTLEIEIPDDKVATVNKGWRTGPGHIDIPELAMLNLINKAITSGNYKTETIENAWTREIANQCLKRRQK